MADQELKRAAEAQDQDVGRIRDIIFGTQMRTYEQRFVVLQRDVERLSQQLAQIREQLGTQIEEQDAKQTKKLQELRRDAEQAADSLREELRATAQALSNDKTDRLGLADMLAQVASYLRAGGEAPALLDELKDK